MRDPDTTRHDLGVHPDLRDALQAYRNSVGEGGLGAIVDVPERRRVFGEFSRRGAEGRVRPRGLDVRSYDIAGTAGAPDVAARLYRPRTGVAELLPVWIYVHGGGMVLGDLDSSDLAAAHLAADSGCAILSVDYRLAPEHRFPRQVDDCEAALTWLRDQAEGLRLDRERIGVYGVSAGGAIAASLALRLRGDDERAIAKQILIYPMLDDRSSVDPTTPDAPAGTWSHVANARAWQDYLGPAAATGGPPAGAVPARAESLAGLPPTYLEVGSIDILAAETLAYARRLVTDGVATEFHLHPGAYHAFDAMAPGSGVGLAARASRLRAMTQM